MLQIPPGIGNAVSALPMNMYVKLFLGTIAALIFVTIAQFAMNIMKKVLAVAVTIFGVLAALSVFMPGMVPAFPF